MSVTTESDRKMDLARYELALALAHAARAVAAIDAALEPDTWGADEWDPAFLVAVAKVRKRLVGLEERTAALGARAYCGVPERYYPMEACCPPKDEP